MSEDLDYLYYEWNQATAELPWGVQRAFHSVFEAARDNGTTLVYASDYSGGFPCLVNSVGTMLTAGGGHGIPSSNFGRVVSAFDKINRLLAEAGVNTEPGRVSPLAADIFLTHFAPLKDQPEMVAEVVVPDALGIGNGAGAALYSDEELEQALNDMFKVDPPVEVSDDYYSRANLD